jgi:hypothetical protein
MTEINQLLADWHNWSAGYKPQTIGACAMFKSAKSPRHWDTTAEIDDSLIDNASMKAIDFAVLGDAKGQGGMIEPYRSAILVKARNLATSDVFTSPRLPEKQVERVKIINEALDMLRSKLKTVGVV